MSEYKFKGKAYISGSRQDKDGNEIIFLQFSPQQSVEVAKFKLMGRSLKDYQPELLEITGRRANGKPKRQRGKELIKRKAL